MQDFVASVLASLVADYAKPSDIDPSFLPSPEETVIGRNVPKTRAVKAVKVEAATFSNRGRAQAAPIAHLPGPVSMPLPEAGTLGAEGFLKAMRAAGVRKGKMEPIAKREDEIRAIASYIGYDSSKLHGEQEVAARMQAQRDLKPVIAAKTEYKRNGSPLTTGEGYVAGLFDAKAKQVADLKGREVAAADALIAHRNDSRDTSRTPEQRAQSRLLIKLEDERLEAIRADLALLGVE